MHAVSFSKLKPSSTTTIHPLIPPTPPPHQKEQHSPYLRTLNIHLIFWGSSIFWFDIVAVVHNTYSATPSTPHTIISSRVPISAPIGHRTRTELNSHHPLHWLTDWIAAEYSDWGVHWWWWWWWQRKTNIQHDDDDRPYYPFMGLWFCSPIYVRLADFVSVSISAHIGSYMYRSMAPATAAEWWILWEV